MSELISSGLLVAYQDPLNRLYGFQIDEIPDADLNQLKPHDVLTLAADSDLSYYTFGNEQYTQTRNIDFNNSYLIRIYKLDYTYIVTEAGISNFGVRANRNSIFYEDDMNDTSLTPTEINSMDGYISRIIMPIPELSVANSNTYISTISYNWKPFQPKHVGQAYALARYHRVTPYNIGIQYSGTSFVKYNIENLVGRGYEFYNTQKSLYIGIDGADVYNVVKNPSVFVDYKLEIDNKLIHNNNSNYNTTEQDGIRVVIGTNDILYDIDVDKFLLSQSINDYKDKVTIKYTIEIKNAENNDIIDSNNIEFDIDLIDYSSHAAHITDASGAIIEGYINEYVTLDKTDSQLIDTLFRRASLKLNLNNINILDFNPVNNIASYSNTNKLNDIVKSKRGTILTLNTKIVSAMNSWDIKTEDICFINDLFFNINNVNLNILGSKSNNDPVSLQYLDSEVDAERSKSRISEIKFLSDGPVTVEANFTVNKNDNYLYAVSTKVNAIPNPTDIYFIAFKRNPDNYNIASSGIYQFDANTTSHKNQRGINELDYFPNVNTIYGQTIIDDIDNMADTIYTHKSIPAQNLPYIFEKESYTMQLDIPDNGEYSFYIIISNDMIGTTSHCISNTTTKNINSDAYYDIPWRF